MKHIFEYSRAIKIKCLGHAVPSTQNGTLESHAVHDQTGLFNAHTHLSGEIRNMIHLNLTLYTLMDSSFWFDTMKLGQSIVHI